MENFNNEFYIDGKLVAIYRPDMDEVEILETGEILYAMSLKNALKNVIAVVECSPPFGVLTIK